MYEKTGNIIKLARENNTSVIAFICMDYVMARTVVYAAEATKTPAVVMLYPEHVTVQKTTGFRNYAAMVKELADEVSVPIGLHCDHDYTYDAIIHTIECGFESVMMDGSMNDLDTNIALTKKVVDRAHELGAIVEGEIGHVGVAADADNHREDLFTKPDAAAKFCAETGVDSLAVSIGNAHGDYPTAPELAFDVLEQINMKAGKPLVLHGGSGLTDEDFQKAVSLGISKINIGTASFNKVTQSAGEYLQEPGKHTFFQMSTAMTNGMYLNALRHIKVFNSME